MIFNASKSHVVTCDPWMLLSVHEDGK